jgi:D-glycero-alpha-D-manno-heptose-7-phosphate kinase
MIITRSPLRISLGGGGTDLPSYYRKFGGTLLAGAIDKYIFVTVNRIFKPEYIIKYSSVETVNQIENIKHPIIREAMLGMDFGEDFIEITSMADIPSGTGLGSSGSFTTALVKALHQYKRHILHPRELAEEACKIEIDKLKEPIGKQDQFIAAFGGLTKFSFNKDGSIDAEPLKMSDNTLYELEDNLLLFFTGYSRTAGSILKEQDVKSKVDDSDMINNLHFIKDLGVQSIQALETGRLDVFAELMNVHWESKKKRSNMMSNSHIDEWFQEARKNGALGGKLVGAGGGGFLMFYANNKALLRKTMSSLGLKEVRFKFDFEGCKVLL